MVIYLGNDDGLGMREVVLDGKPTGFCAMNKSISCHHHDGNRFEGSSGVVLTISRTDLLVVEPRAVVIQPAQSTRLSGQGERVSYQ